LRAGSSLPIIDRTVIKWRAQPTETPRSTSSQQPRWCSPRHGLDQARVDDIAARAGKSKGAFYLHFDSKEEAFREIIESLLARLHSCVREQTDAPLPSSPADT